MTVKDDVRTSACLWTDCDGWIRDTTPEAAALLNVTSRYGPPRQLIVFFVENRDQLRRLLDDASRGHVGSMSTRLRPRERRPLPVRVRLEPEPERPGFVRWELTAVQAPNR